MSATSHNGVEVSALASTKAVGSGRDGFRALRSTCGLFDLKSRACLRLTGSDRVRWLNGMITNNVRDLAAGHGTYAFLLNPQGHILGDLYAYNRNDYLMVVTDGGQKERILSTFDHYIIMDDVEVEDASGSVAAVGVAGPKSRAILRSAGINPPELQPLEIAELTWRDHSLTVVGGESDRYPSFEIWITPGDEAALHQSLEAAGARLVNRGALELYRIALGRPCYGQDIRERDLPQETEQHRALNFNKGCYVGQEIVERIRSRGNVHRKFTGFQINGPAAAPGTKIQAQAKDVGEVTSSAVIPAAEGGDCAVALGYVRREVGVPGREVQIADAPAVVTELPLSNLLVP
jgi:folate-binding protein YgfZ